MRILYIAQRVPYPPNKGDKLRSFNQIKFLSQFHELSLVCLTDDKNDLRHKPVLEKYCTTVDIVFRSSLLSSVRAFGAIFTGRCLTRAYFHSMEMQKTVRARLCEIGFDLLFVYCSSMAQYVEDVCDIPKVIDFVDVDSEKWAQYARHARQPRRQIYALESRRLRRYEASLCSKFQHGFLVSHKEVEDFRKLVLDTGKVSALMNGVDLVAFRPDPLAGHGCNLVFTGVMNYFANVETVLYCYREILPLVRKSVPEAKLYVVGSHPVRELLALAAEDPNLVVTGQVEAVQPYLRQACVFVAPMRIARGVQNKILEAMAMGVPVVTNSLGSQGVSAVRGTEILIEDTPAGFAREVVRLITDRRWREEVARNGREAVTLRYDWTRNLGELNDILIELWSSLGTEAGSAGGRALPGISHSIGEEAR